MNVVLPWVGAATGLLVAAGALAATPWQRRKLTADTAEALATAGQQVTDAAVKTLQAVIQQRNECARNLATCQRHLRRKDSQS